MLLPRDPANLDDRARGTERNRRAVLTSGVAMLARVVRSPHRSLLSVLRLSIWAMNASGCG